MKDLIRMNQLAGLITENQAQKMMAVLNENYTVGQAIKDVEGEDAEVLEVSTYDKNKEAIDSSIAKSGWEPQSGKSKEVFSSPSSFSLITFLTSLVISLSVNLTIFLIVF